MPACEGIVVACGLRAAKPHTYIGRCMHLHTLRWCARNLALDPRGLEQWEWGMRNLESRNENRAAKKRNLARADGRSHHELQSLVRFQQCSCKLWLLLRQHRKPFRQPAEPNFTNSRRSVRVARNPQTRIPAPFSVAIPFHFPKRRVSTGLSAFRAPPPRSPIAVLTR